MNLDLKSDKISYMRPVFKRRFMKEETVEVIVPDALPDILRIVDTDGETYMRSKDADSGRVMVTGVSELSVLYVPENGGGVRCISVSVPFSAAAEGGEITADALITARAELTLADARTVNPRKIVVRAEVAVEAACYVSESIYNTARQECGDIYFLEESRELTLPSAVNEKTFIFTDELKLPSGAPEVGEILKTSVSLELESAKPVGSKAVVKGSAVTRILYEPRDGGLRVETFTTPYSIIVETDAPTEPARYSVDLMLTGTYVNRGYSEDSEVISLEVHAVAQCVSWCLVRETRVSDLYSTKYKLEETCGRYEIPSLAGCETLEETAASSIPVAGRASAVHEIYIKIINMGVSSGAEGTVFSAVLSATALYSDEKGELTSSTRKFEVERALEAASGSVDVVVSQRGEAYAAPQDGTIDIRVPLTLDMTCTEKIRTEQIEGVDFDESTLVDLTNRASITVVRATAKRSLWELAKSYYSTVELIRGANGLSDGADPEVGRVLLIPRNM